MLGKLFSAPLRVVNAPLRAVELMVAAACGDSLDNVDRPLSGGIEEIAKVVEEITDKVVKNE